MYKNPALLIKFCSIGFLKIKKSLKLRKTYKLLVNKELRLK